MADLLNPIFNDETAARQHLEAIRWPDGPVCPYCGTIDAASEMGGKDEGTGWYSCRACRKKYTVRVGSVYERSHIPLHKWVLATHLMASSKKGMSAHQLHRMLGITYKSAWFMAHRIREAMKPTTATPMGGAGKIVEADETYYGPKAVKTRHSVKGEPLSPRAYKGVANKRTVISLVERGGEVRSFHVERANRATVEEIVSKNASKESRLHTDESPIYKRTGKTMAAHETVEHKKEEYARGDVHVNSAEGFFSIFKRGMTGVYQHCGEQHLHRYLNEFDFRYNNRTALKITDEQRAARALKGAEGRRLTYRRTNGA
jgi:transposase-like protein